MGKRGGWRRWGRREEREKGVIEREKGGRDGWDESAKVDDGRGVVSEQLWMKS